MVTPRADASPDDRVRKLVELERYRRDASGALVPRPAADIAYRLQTWYRVPGITAAHVATLLATR